MGNYLKKHVISTNMLGALGGVRRNLLDAVYPLCMAQKISPHPISLNPPRFVGMTHFRIVSTIL